MFHKMWISICFVTLFHMVLTKQTLPEKVDTYDLQNNTKISGQISFEKGSGNDVPVVGNEMNYNLNFSEIEDIDSYLKNVLEIKWYDITRNEYYDVRKANKRINKKANKKGKKPKALISKPLEPKYRNELLELHNEARRNVDPSASNMRKLTWDDELEKIALEKTSACNVDSYVYPEHPRYGGIKSTLVISTKIHTIDSAIIRCSLQVFQQNGRLCMTTKNATLCESFRNMAHAKAFKVGCGVTLCQRMDVGNSLKKGVMMICVYGPGYPTEEPYIIGKRCSKCDKAERCVNGLCSHQMREEFNATTAKMDIQMDAEWSNWTNWSKCSKTCGKAIRKRTRICSSYLGVDCEGNDKEVKKCITKFCRPNLYSRTSFKKNTTKRQ